MAKWEAWQGILVKISWRGLICFKSELDYSLGSFCMSLLTVGGDPKGWYSGADLGERNEGKATYYIYLLWMGTCSKEARWVWWLSRFIPASQESQVLEWFQYRMLCLIISIALFPWRLLCASVCLGPWIGVRKSMWVSGPYHLHYNWQHYNSPFSMACLPWGYPSLILPKDTRWLWLPCGNQPYSSLPRHTSPPHARSGFQISLRANTYLFWLVQVLACLLLCLLIKLFFLLK